MSLLKYVPPMGIYETLYAFLAASGSYMGDEGTHPFSQGFPRTDQIPGGPAMPVSVSFDSRDLMYPKAWGHPKLREAIANYYRTHYGAKIAPDNVMVFAGGRPGLVATLLFLEQDVTVSIAETEYTPYYDMLQLLHPKYEVVGSNAGNDFSPGVNEYFAGSGRRFPVISLPCNPTARTRSDSELEAIARGAASGENGALIDEAYELFQPTPTSVLAHVDNIDDTGLMVAGAVTKGLQAPGFRIGWIVASRDKIEILSNFSSFGMGGVSHPSQLAAAELFDPARIALARTAIPAYYGEQRARYGEALERLGIRLFSGDGGFYHWCQLPGGLSAAEFNERLFRDKAAILKGTDCDMLRRGDDSPLRDFFRFSFGPLHPEQFEENVAIIERALAA